MRISRVQIDNYRNLKHIDIDLDKIVVLIGENNSGKSNFLRALSIPLTSDDVGIHKRLSWDDINRENKQKYYDYLLRERMSIINGTMTLDEFSKFIPYVKIQLFFQPDDKEHYNINDILINEGEWIGGILYKFYVKKPEELFARVQKILANEENELNLQMSLLPIDLYDYTITVPTKDNKVSYDTLSRFSSVNLPAERDNFASNADRLGSRALSDLLRKSMTTESQVKIEKAYTEFFDTVKDEGNLDKVLNWQQYSDIENAQTFFDQINILPNMPQMSSILGGIRLGYAEESMYMQGLGYRNMILMTVLLNSYLNKQRDISFRLMTVEEPEAHLCISNTLLMANLINVFSKKNSYTQIVYSTHNVELVNKVGLDSVIVMKKGEAFSLKNELNINERDYLVSNPNTDIFKLLYSRRTILVEGITEELLIKSYFQTQSDLNDIKILSFHKGFTKIIDIWKKINKGTENKLGVVRDYDDQPKAQKEHEKRQDNNVMVRTTKEYTLETDITELNYELIKKHYGDLYGWSNMNSYELQKDWREKKADVMIRICHDLINGDLSGFVLPNHIQEIVDFMRGIVDES